jgi:pimeloyl-ACP methyl ester carboxylesterase
MKPIRVKTENVKISILASAPIEKPWASVIFIHGFPFNKSIWKKQFESLPEGVQGIIYDVRGHGNSSSGHGYFSVDLFAKDLLDLIKNLRLSKVILCGVSMGGYIALRAMELAPEKISGLILSDTNSVSDSNEVKLNRFAQIETIMNKDKETFADEFMKKVFSPNTVQKKPQIVEAVKDTILYNKEKNICSTLLALASRTDSTPSLEKINIPTLIIRGEDDQMISKEQVEILHKGIKGSKLEEIPLSGHLPNVENPEKFNELVKNFLEENFNK